LQYYTLLKVFILRHKNIIMTQSIIFSIPDSEVKNMIQDAVNKAFIEYNLKQRQDDSTELLTRSETAKFLGVSLPTLNDYTKQSIIIGYRLGGKVRYKKNEILNALQAIGKAKYGRGLK